MNAHKFHAPRFIGIVVVVGLLVAHAALWGYALRGHLSVALLAGMLGVVAVKFLWWKRRR